MELEWKTVRIDEIGKIVTGNTPSKKNSSYFGGKYPWIKPTDIRIGRRYVNKTEETYSELAFTKYKKCFLPPLTTCVVTIGTVGEKICLTKESSFTNQSINAIIPKEGKYDPMFVYYLMKYNLPKVAKRNPGTASGRHHVSKSNFSSMVVSIPAYPIQKEISAILSPFDDLIEINERKVEILEKTAELIYHEWFVHFRYLGHEQTEIIQNTHGPTPKGWKWHNLFDVADVTFGKALKSDYFSEESKGFPIVRIRDILNNCTNTYTTESVEKKYFVKNGDILIGMDGDFHMCRWAGGDAYLVQRVARFRPKGSMSPYFLFWALKRHIEYFNATITGTTVAHLGKKHLETVEILVPSEETMEKVNRVFDTLYQQEITLRSKNMILKDMRDLMLPKLISGEIEANKLGIVDLSD